MRSLELLRRALGSFHWFMTGLLLLLLFPAFKIAHLPFRFDWPRYFVGYWLSLGIQSILLASVFYSIQFPSRLWLHLTTYGRQISPTGPFIAVFTPAAYFFVGLVLSFSYNDVIAALRFDGSADLALSNIDAYLLGGRSVHELALLAPAWAVEWSRFIYFRMFPQMGSCLLLLALCKGRRGLCVSSPRL